MMNGLNMKDILKKAKEMQDNLAQKKEDAAKKTVDVSVGGGMVKMVMNGNFETVSIKIDPEIVDKEDVEILEDLVRAAINESDKQAKELVSTELSQTLHGLNLSDLTNF
ncbi:YbaB/EbfC family nucleoid-associated protein [bacterium]|nr:YbaB/EbfC family nucleoid-associated protein [bacterium]